MCSRGRGGIFILHGTLDWTVCLLGMLVCGELLCHGLHFAGPSSIQFLGGTWPSMAFTLWWWIAVMFVEFQLGNLGSDPVTQPSITRGGTYRGHGAVCHLRMSLVTPLDCALEVYT